MHLRMTYTELRRLDLRFSALTSLTFHNQTVFAKTHRKKPLQIHSVFKQEANLIFFLKNIAQCSFFHKKCCWFH